MTNKLLLIAAAAGTLAFASCQGESSTGMTDEVMQAKVDSAVQARMAEMQAQLAAQNDSLINAMAMMKADSMMAANATSNPGTSRPAPARPSTTTRTTTPTVPTKPARTEQDRKFENRENGNSNQTISPEKAKEQDDKFNRRGGGN